MNLIYAIPLLVFSTSAFAQAPIKVGDMVDLEERVLYKKMADELSKPNPNAPPPPPPVIVMPKAPKVAHRTEMLDVYGTSATGYQGRLTMGGKVYPVSPGTVVEGYVVKTVSPHGTTLVKKDVGKQRSGKKIDITLFAPLPQQQ